MQEQGIIKQSDNIVLFTLLNMMFWLFPIRRYINKDDEKHNQLAKRVNTSLLGMLVMAIVLVVLMKLSFIEKTIMATG
ncbi:hypothetical protein KFE94_07180 [bacterium SCSIO 12643]|nr:hypothetical protein KFE94_07180 [bacterium SCSIO 12643]